MKKLYFLATILILSMAASAQDTIIGFNFKTNLFANFGTDTNKLNSIAVDGPSGSFASITMTFGVTGDPDKAATATNWDGGADSKCWITKVYTKGFTGIKLSSKLSSGGNKPGPRDLKVQYRVGVLGTWTDLAGATSITTANDWTTGVVNAVALPIECENLDSMVYVRWIMTSNISNTSATVLATGILKIDDIFITGTKISTSIKQETNIPFHITCENRQLNLSNINDKSDIQLYSMDGRLVYSANNIIENTTINAPSENMNLYILRIIENNKAVINRKIIF